MGDERQERLDAIYNHPSTAKHMHHGLNTKTKYGFIARGRLIQGGVFKADIRMRPDLYICANCRELFVVTRTDIYCGNCSSTQLDSLRHGKPQPKEARPAIKVIEEPKPLAPPPDLTQLDSKPFEPQPTYLIGLNLDIPRWEYIRGILSKAGIETVEDIEDFHEKNGLTSISGIGEKTANLIFDEMDL